MGQQENEFTFGKSPEGSSPAWGQPELCEVLGTHHPSAAYSECVQCSKSIHLFNVLTNEDLF